MSIHHPHSSYLYPEFGFNGVSVYQQLASVEGKTYFTSADIADVTISRVTESDINDSSQQPSSPFKFTVTPHSGHHSFEIQNVELFFLAPTTCRDNDQGLHTNSPAFEEEMLENLDDDFVEVQVHKSSSTTREQVLDSISFRKAIEHGLVMDSQHLHSHIFDLRASSSRPRTVQLILHVDDVNFVDILNFKGWVVDS